MPSIDALRQRVRLSPTQLDVLRRSTTGELVDADKRVLTTLVKSELFVEGEVPHPLVLDLARVMTQPMMQITIETTSAHGPTYSTLALHEEDIWFTDPWPGTDPETDELVYQREELPQLLWILKALTGLRRREVPSVARPFQVPFGALSDILLLMGGQTGSGWDDLRAAALTGLDETFPDMPDEDRALLIGVIGSIQATWRVTCGWGADPLAKGHVRGFAVWDCGAAGYWVRTTPAEPLSVEDLGKDVVATYEPRDAGQLWEAFADLLPSSDELRASITVPEGSDGQG
ncbi:hypothetical protein [Luteipulveratus mongoliensis]|uniref:Uncharacterized protein n=1 Tax=Luteipulveratus mongoliensis TaxID=571913 RepID=A0A0K1JN95_9MICO|nr:hypothetical protein [Luteipulveratus mongoliensis]AKU18058.1 hypothetical protein VV02_22990 [Luteipulveratus mongoliensis]